jgi:NitT/TauT family transport system substrate-binding protein
VRAVLSSYTQITSGAAAKLTLPKWPAEINTQSVQTLADLAVKDGILDKAPNMADLVP